MHWGMRSGYTENFSQNAVLKIVLQFYKDQVEKKIIYLCYYMYIKVFTQAREKAFFTHWLEGTLLNVTNRAIWKLNLKLKKETLSQTWTFTVLTQNVRNVRNTYSKEALVSMYMKSWHLVAHSKLYVCLQWRFSSFLWIVSFPLEYIYRWINLQKRFTWYMQYLFIYLHTNSFSSVCIFKEQI